MNRIVLIGNGFDLAHDIKTSYKHFIDHLWSEIISEINSKALFEPFKNDLLNITQNLNFCKNRKDYSELKSALNHVKTKYEFKNDFFRTISEKHYLNNWVDIENEYYSQLKDLIKDPNKETKIIKLNSDFEVIIKLLKSYLTDINNGNTDKNSTIENHVNSYSNSNDFNESYVDERVKIEYENLNRIIKIIDDDEKYLLLERDLDFYSEFISSPDPLSKIRKRLKSDNANVFFDMFPKEVLFLNFNYTDTHSLYADIRFNKNGDNIKAITTSLQIHGALDDKKKNPIIFGFGDELDDDYKSIEKLNNDFLDHIKSMKYLETGNYKQLLEFINSDNYEVFIFGHSCGVSDRTLLNTLFENDNCISIKPFYYKEEGKDNFNDIIKNISRNFNNKVSMRDKVVNKTNCVPLT